ncbi:MAG: glycosyltransferase [Duncaniella sp.]|nr:glycosyltransferase [Duncaniella sp.]
MTTTLKRCTSVNAYFEHIIVDGLSKDNTLDIVREFEPQYNGRLKYISERDKGLYDAMNKGIGMATGDVIGILNSDDFYTSNDILEQVVKNIGDVDAVYGDIHYVDDSDLTKCVRKYSSKGFRRWKMRLGFMPAHPSFYCRRRIYSQYGLFDLDFRVAADFEQLLRLIFINRIVTRYIPMDFVTMRTGGASSSGLQSHRKIIKDHMLAYRKNGVYSNYFLEGLRYLHRIVEIVALKIASVF